MVANSPPSETNILNLVERLRSHEIPQADVRGHFELVREWVGSQGYATGPPEMPPIRVYAGLRRRDWLSLLPKLCQLTKRMGWDMDEAQKTEHGEVRLWEETPAAIFGGPAGIVILVRKGFGPRYVRHEMIHIFETYLGLKPGTLEKQNIDLWALWVHHVHTYARPYSDHSDQCWDAWRSNLLPLPHSATASPNQASSFQQTTGRMFAGESLHTSTTIPC